jgi:hypothetical protein
MNIFNNDNNVVSLGILFVLLILLVYVIIRNYVSGKFIENFVDSANIFNGDKVHSLNVSGNLLSKLENSYDSSIGSLITDKRQEVLNEELVQIDNINNMVRRNNNILKTLKDSIDKKQNIDKYPAGEPIKTIKSKYNSQVISVVHQDNKYYKIQINDKCLSVYGDNNYKLSECVIGEPNFPVQLFYQEVINNASDIKRVFGEYPGININYPYSVFKSAITDQFLTSADSGITVEPGIPNDIRQQWLISPMAYGCQ